MEFEGKHRLSAPRRVVWEALNDPAILQSCIPGCESLERDGDRLSAVVVAKVGLVRMRFGGEIRLEAVRAPESCRLVGEGKGGIAGFAKGGAEVRLAEIGPETILTYRVEAEVGGRLAGLGGRLIEGSAARLSARFFERFAARVADADEPQGESGAAGGRAPPSRS